MSIPLSVLLLEDRAEDAELIVSELRAADFAPVWHRVESEVDYLARLDPTLDLILADNSVPDFDALRALDRTQALGLDIPFIIVTGSLEDAAAVECIKQGAADYLLKDRLRRLGPAVQQALQARQGRAARREAEAVVVAHTRSLADLVAQRNAILDQMPSGLVVVDATGRLMLMNEEGRRISGGSPHLNLEVPDQATEYEIRDVTTGGPIPPAKTPLGRALAGETIAKAEYLFRRPGETVDVWAGATAAPLRDVDGKITGALAVFSDITEQRRLVQAEATSELRYRTLYQAVACGIVESTSAGIILDADHAAEAITGYPLDDLRGQIWSRALRDTTREDGSPLADADRPFAVVQRTGQPVHGMVLGIRRQDGERRLLQVDAVPVAAASGAVEHIVTSFIDVTAHKAAEAQATREHAEKVALLESTSDGIFGVDRAGRFSSINQPRTALLGHAPEEMLGQPVHPMIHARYADGRPYPLEASPIQHVLQSQLAVRVAGEVLWHKDGTALPFEYSCAPIFTDGVLQGVVVAFRDVTERQLAEAALRASNLQLETALAELHRSEERIIQQERLRALGEMASGIAHDFNNTLAPILGYSELLLARPQLWADQATSRQYLQMINTGAQDAASVVRRLREFYRERESHDALQPVDLSALAQQVIDLTQPRWKDQAQARGQQIDVQTDVEPVPAIAGDAAELREVLTNLIFNAVDALPTGGTIRVQTRANEDRVLLTVSDSGAGMPADVRARCLEPFFSTKGEQGTGLGLAMVYGTVQRHGGTLDIESAPGQGTTIRICFPLGEAASTPSVAPVAVGLTRPLHVLVVDDDERVRAVTVMYLTGDGHTVEAAENGADGLKLFLAGHFDVVLTDRAMPGMTGDQLAIAMKRLSPGTPVIMMTGFGTLMASEGPPPDGVDAVVNKPARLGELQQALAAVMQPRHPEQPGAAA